MAEELSSPKGPTPMLKVVLVLSAAALVLGGVNTVMIMSERKASREIVAQLQAAERTRQQDVAEAARLRKAQEDAASQAMRFR